MIIQGGMGVGVSGWQLANAVASYGQLGVVSGTALDTVMIRRLQLGDAGGHVRRALEAFPVPDVAKRIHDKYFIDGGKEAHVPFRSRSMPSIKWRRPAAELVAVANFVEVFLAKEGHENPVGINYLEKIQIQTLASIYGAMMAGVDYVLMGAGIPKAIPAVLERFAAGESAELGLDVKDGTQKHVTRFDPQEFLEGAADHLPRPKFLAIVASHVLATMLSRAEVPPDGFVVEGPTAGGHNAPPRKKEQTDTGEPLYGPRDVVDLEAMADLGRPFWLAGSQGSPDSVKLALEAGAAGVQVGTAFAFCEESGMLPELKASVLAASKTGDVQVFTDPLASPTGFPFKVIQHENTWSDPEVYEKRERICDLGYLRNAYETSDGKVKYRCPSEPVQVFIGKGGDIADTVKRQCLCNGLMSNIGLGQMRDGVEEGVVLTAGDDAADVARFLPQGAESYKASDVIDQLIGFPVT